jgi:hypothetical protein
MDLTAEDMADLIAGHTINAMIEGGEEIIVAAPDGVNKDWDSTAPEPAEPATRLVPDFSMDVAGEYGGNAYPEQREYRVTMAHDPTDGAQMLVVDSGGAFVAEPLVITPELADGITSMATTNHDLDGYRDDWTLPDGMGRSLSWMLQTDIDDTIELGEHQIEQIADWLDYATGAKTWDWVSDGEEWNH